MSIDKEMISQLLRDLKIDRAIEDAHQILDLNRDGKWPIRLLLLSYLLKENELQRIREFVDFGFSKVANDSLFHRFDFKRIRSTLAMPEKWFENESDDSYITGSGNARSHPSKRSDLFTKLGSSYTLNETNGSKKLALVLFIYLLNAHGIDLTEISERVTEEDASTSRELYERLFLIDSAGKPTSLFHKVQDIIETYPMLAQEAEFDKDTESILPHIQMAILNLLQRHPNAFRKPPQKKKLTIVCDSIYSLSACAGDERFVISNLLNRSSSKKEYPETGLEEERIDDSGTSPTLLIGSAGSGKSFWMIQLASDLWNESFKSGKSKKNGKWIPIFIELGSVLLSKTKRGEALIYGGERDPLRYRAEEPDEVPGRSLIDRSLGAMLKKSSQYVRKVLDRVDWHEMKFVFLLDGWDELGHRERKEMIKFIESCGGNQIPCIISSRSRDSYFDSLEPEYFTLEKPNLDNCRDYLHFRGMEEDVLDKINEWFPNLSPLDLEILGRVPRMEEISSGRVPVYRTWIELQVLSSVRKDIPYDLVSRSEIDQIIEREFYSDKSLKEWIRSGDDSHSVWNYLPYIAYLQRDGRHTSLSYDRVIQDNPLLKDLLEKRYGSGDSPHPEILRNNLIPYLSAEYIFKGYLAGSYAPIRSDSQTFEFLLEILSYDLERRHDGKLVERNAELTPLEVASMICLQGESEVYDSVTSYERIRPLVQKETSRSTPFYTALFHGFVRYWSQTSNQRTRRIILDAFAKLIHTIIIEGKEDNPERYIIPIIEIEHRLENADLSKLIAKEPDKTVDMEIRDSAGYTLYFLDYDRVQNWLVEITAKKPWLAPWTVRVVEQENMPRIREIVDEAHDDQMVYEVISYVTSGFTSINDEWLGSMHSNARRLESARLWNSLAYGLTRTRIELDDYRFSILLEVIGCPKVEDKWKLELIYALRKARLPQRYTREVWRSTEHGEIDFKNGIAICLSQELPDVSMDDIFKAISESEGLGCLGLLLPGILQEKHGEREINNRFIQLSFSVVQALRRTGVAPWDEERLASLVDLWWAFNLQNIEDALGFIRTISKRKREDKLATLDYRETEVLERLAGWLKCTRKPTKKKFFRKLIESDIDITDLSVRKYLYPFYQEIENRTDLDELLVARYPGYLRGMQTLPLSRESWLKHIDKVDREDILEWSWLMEIYLESGNITSIDEAIELLDEIKNQSDYLIETFEPLSKWVLQRPTNEIAAFTLRLIKENPATTRMGYWQSVKESGVIEAISPAEKKSPEVYDRIFEIAKEMPVLTIDIRSELQFLFEQLTSDDQLKAVRPHIEKFLGKELFFLRKSLAELILMHGMKKDVDTLIRSLNKEPRNLGTIWQKNVERSKQISKRLSNSLSKLLYEIDMTGGWDEYKKELEKNPKKAEEDLLLFLDNDWISKGFMYLTSGTVLREMALKHWKRIFLSDKSLMDESERFLGNLFQDDNEEILEYIAGEIDRIHRNLKEKDEETPRLHRTSWHSWDVSALKDIRDRCGYAGLRKLLSRIKEPYAAEGVLTYLIGAAKKEGVPESEILSMQEFQQLSKESKWHLLKEFGVKKNNS